MTDVGALILAGGRSSRLGGSSKWNFEVGGRSLLRGSVEALRADGVREIVIVGDEGVDDVPAVRESPAYAGPVAAIAAGVAALSPWVGRVLVLASDMPGVARALPGLLAATGGAMAVDRGRRQHLAFIAPADELRTALDAVPGLEDAPVRTLHAVLRLPELDVPDGATDDIDTWADAARLGAVPPHPLRRTHA